MAASAEELRQLQQEVNKLRERLDFMAPMLSLLNFTQDFFQRVECEASVQLMRLKNAKLDARSNGSAPPDGEKVDTAKWLHTMTDLVMALQTTATPPPAPPPAPLPGAEPVLQWESPVIRARNPEDKIDKVGIWSNDDSDMSQKIRDEKVFWRPGNAASGGTAPSSNAPASASMPMTGSRGRLPAPSSVRSAPPLVSALDNTLEFAGLSLGKGTWANAYRQATGARRDALRLLCTSGIVTERELADDLTVIQDDHVEECIAIAQEMLRRWPSDRGPPPQRESKAFFEERLAALYMQRAPVAFGSH